MATITQARLAGPTQPGTTDGVLYTVPAATAVIVKEIVLTNTTASPATVSVAVNGTAATGANCLLAAYSVPANGTVVFALSTVLAAGDTLHALQGTASAVTATVSGVTIA